MACLNDNAIFFININLQGDAIMTIKYHLYDKSWRNSVDLRDYKYCLDYAIRNFPMIKLIQVTEDDFTIRVNTSDVNAKNRVVKSFGRMLANNTDLQDFTVFRYGSYKLIVEKK